MRRLAFLLLLAGCASGSEEKGNDTAPANAVAAPTAAPSAADLAASRAAAAALAAYYEAIGRRDYRAAFARREPVPGITFERFAATYDRYADYRATVGVPSGPVRQGGDSWVWVPVQLYGRMRDGSPTGSVGRVTMKLAAGSHEWKVVS